MDKSTTHLIDEIIDFSREKRIPIDKLGQRLVDLAKQRLPEYEIEAMRREFSWKISESPSISLFIRVIMVSWVHEVSWSYYPQFHVVWRHPSEPHAFPIDWSNRPPISDEGKIYLDNLYYDPEAERFWQDEPFLSKLPVCKRLYQQLISRKLQNLKGSDYGKIDPALVTEIIHARKGVPDYIVKTCDDKAIHSRAYGSKGWRLRMKGVLKVWSHKRKHY